MKIYLVYEGYRYEGEHVIAAFHKQEDAERLVAEEESRKGTRLDPYWYWQDQEVV